MSLTVTLVLFVLVWHVRQNGFARSVLHAFSWVCLFYIAYFWHNTKDIEMQFAVDVAVCFSFICFSIPFLVFHTRALQQSNRFMSYVWDGKFAMKSMSSSQVVFLAIIPVLFCVLFLYIRIARTGSLESALYGFYAVKHSNTHMFLARFNSFLFKISLGVLFFLRYDSLMYEKRLSLCLFWILSILLIITLFIRGTRGNLLIIPVVMLLADACTILRGSTKSVLKPGFVLLSIIALAGILLLSSIRGNSYNSMADILDYVNDQGSEHTFWKDSALVTSRGGSIGDDIAFSMNYYGKKEPYLYFYTPWSIIVNLIPREYWKEKPVGFGRMLSWAKGAPQNTNVSFAAGLAGEGYANGGWIGIFLLSTTLGVICGISSGLSFGFFFQGAMVHLVLACFLQRFACFFVRGDMLSAWASIYPIILFIVVIRMANSTLKREI